MLFDDLIRDATFRWHMGSDFHVYVNTIYYNFTFGSDKRLKYIIASIFLIAAQIHAHVALNAARVRNLISRDEYWLLPF